MSNPETSGDSPVGGGNRCPLDECQCDDWPPVKCPQCGVRTLGFTPEDWWRHFNEECKTVGGLFCFAHKPAEDKPA